MDNLDNPWVNSENVIQMRALVARTDPQLARRDWGGEWVSSGDLLFEDVWKPDLHIKYGESWELSDYDLGDDVTEQVTRRAFRKPHRWWAGVDVNRRPMTHLMAKAFGDKDDPDSWGVFVMDRCRPFDVDTYQAAGVLAERERGRFKACGVILDGESAMSTHQAHTGGSKANTPLLNYRRRGFTTVRPAHKDPTTGKPCNPSRRDSTQLLFRLMREGRLYVHARADGLITAIEQCVDDPTCHGAPKKTKGDTYDRDVTGFIDALRYLVWATFSKQMLIKRTRIL